MRGAWIGPTLAFALAVQPCRAEESPGARALPSALSPGDDANPAEAKQQAKELFDRGVTEARRGEVATSLHSFQRAYELSPHYAVLYNIGCAQEALGDLPSAIDTFSAYLERGGTHLTPERATEIRKRLEALKERQQAQLSPPRPPAQTAAEPPLPFIPSAQIPVDPPAPSKSPLDPPAPSKSPLPPPPTDRHGLATRDVAALAFGAAAVVVLGAGLSVFVWNHERYEIWQDQAKQVDALRPGSDEWIREARVANAQLAAVQDTDAVSGVLFAIGSGLAIATLTLAVWPRAPVSISGQGGQFRVAF